jgi:hypothetical protein
MWLRFMEASDMARLSILVGPPPGVWPVQAGQKDKGFDAVILQHSSVQQQSLACDAACQAIRIACAGLMPLTGLSCICPLTSSLRSSNGGSSGRHSSWQCASDVPLQRLLEGICSCTPCAVLVPRHATCVCTHQHRLTCECPVGLGPYGAVCAASSAHGCSCWQCKQSLCRIWGAVLFFPQHIAM